MSEIQRCLCRNSVLGLLAACLCYLVYSPILSSVNDIGHTSYTYTLLATCCSLCFAGGFTVWVSDNDPPFFRYMMSGIRFLAVLTLSITFIGLLKFSWLGMGIGGVCGLWLGLGALKLFGPDKLIFGENDKDIYFHQKIHYFFVAFRIPLTIIPPLVLGGTLLFEWWGLGAGFIGGGLISTLALTLWGPEKPIPPLPSSTVAPTQPMPSHHPASHASTHLNSNVASVSPLPSFPPLRFHSQGKEQSPVDKVSQTHSI